MYIDKGLVNILSSGHLGTFFTIDKYEEISFQLITTQVRVVFLIFFTYLGENIDTIR